MAPLKSALARNLRLNQIAPQSQSIKFVTRGITGTKRNGSQVEITSKSSQSTSFIPRDILSTSSQSSRAHSLPAINTNASTFTTLLAALTTSLTTHPTPNLRELTGLLRSYTSSSSHWANYAHANANKQYTRNLVHDIPGLFNLLLLVWTPGKQSPVHDHADSHCLMKVLKGSLIERRFEIPCTVGEDGNGEEKEMRETSKKRYDAGKVTYIADQLGLHEISNPSPTEYAVSLHLYTPPNAAMRGCHVYDLETGKSKHIMQGAYDSVKGIPTV